MTRVETRWSVLRRSIRTSGGLLYHDVANPMEGLSSEDLSTLASLRNGAMPFERYMDMMKGDSSGKSRLGREGVSPFDDPQNLVGIVQLPLLRRYDLIIVEQGYGGVYVHSYELVKHLRSIGKRVLMLSPEAPLFESEFHADDVFMSKLEESCPGATYVTYCNLLRGLVSHFHHASILIAHRSQTLLLFDLIKGRHAITYCDGFVDGAFNIARDGISSAAPGLGSILDELYFLLACNDGYLKSLYSNPMSNRLLFAAGYQALTEVVENWFWGKEQMARFVESMPEQEKSSRLVLPFLNGGMFVRESVERSSRFLFTTTMHNIDKKGLPELLSAMKKATHVEVDCIVRQPHHLPPIPSSIAPRLHLANASKPEMIRLYHRAWCNVRVSREESSPLSILESMLCEVPQIVSPAVAEQIPQIEDGKTGYVVDPDDIATLAERMTQVMACRKLRDRLGKEARIRAKQLTHANRSSELSRMFNE